MQFIRQGYQSLARSANIAVRVAPLCILFLLSGCGAIVAFLLQLLVGGALAAGFKLTSNLLGGTPKESVDRQAAKANSQNGPSDIEAKVITPLMFGPHNCISGGIFPPQRYGILEALN